MLKGIKWPVNRWSMTALLSVAMIGCGAPGPGNQPTPTPSPLPVPTPTPTPTPPPTPSPTPADLPLVVAINAGSSASASLDGIEFAADRYSVGGTPNATTDTIAGVAEDALYQTERYGNYAYEVPLIAATYTVVLHFAELYHESAGLRSFDVTVEGSVELDDLDLFAVAGHDGAYTYSVDGVVVSDGALSIDLEASVDFGTLAGFAVYSSTGQIDTSAPPPAPPGDLSSTFGLAAGQSKFLGNIWNGTDINSASRQQAFGQLWNQVTLENAAKWDAVEPQRDQMNFAATQAAYDWAKQNGGYYRHHVFVWGSQEPGWMNNLSQSEQRDEIEELIRVTCERFPEMDMIDVVNEPLSNQAPSSYAAALGGGTNGNWAWIVQSFRWAREYCPNSLLGLNAYNIVNDARNRETYKNIINILKQENLIDTVGVQFHHFSVNTMTAASTRSALDDLASLGLPIVVEEFDAEDSNAAQKYREIFPAMWEHPAVIGVTIWGQRKNETWRQQYRMGVLNNDGSDAAEMDFLRSYFN